MNMSNELVKFLNDSGIFIAEKRKKQNNNSFDNDIDNLIQIQKILLNYYKPYSLGIPNVIWKDIETFKVWNRRGRRLIKNYNFNELENVVRKAEIAIDTIYQSSYLNLIHRSMRNNEICVGKVSSNNIWKDGNINIFDLSKMAFNLIEHDCYKYLFKYRKRKNSLDCNKIINSFIKSHNLDNDSKIYIENLLSYPYDSMKIIQKKYLMQRLDKEEIFKKSEFLTNLYNNDLI